VPYCPIHSKYCIVDEQIVMDGSFNWYNTSVYSHDLYVVAKNRDLAQLYENEFQQALQSFRLF
jgi:phosphatidylserine/phosphatidylglycerophosphate/cardiolipin synthase-like enzyme